MKTYLFRVVLEPDEDAWAAYSSVLLQQGASTWGRTREEAMKHIREVVEMVVAELVEHGEPVPEDVRVSEEPLVAVTLFA